MCFCSENGGSVGAEREGGDAAEVGVGVEEFGAVEDGLVGLAPLAGRIGHEVDRVLGDAERLIGVGGEVDVGGFVDGSWVESGHGFAWLELPERTDEFGEQAYAGAGETIGFARKVGVGR